MKIVLRQKKPKKMISLFLDYNRAQHRYEFLNLYLFDETILGRKLTAVEKNKNKEAAIKAELIFNKRFAEQQDGLLKLSGVEMNKRRKISFIEYFDKIMKEREHSSDSNLRNWRSARNQLVDYMNGKNLNLAEVDEEFINGFRSIGFIFRHVGKTMNLFTTFLGLTTNVQDTTMGRTDTGQGKNVEESRQLVNKGYDLLEQIIETTQESDWLGMIETPFFGKVTRVRLFSHILIHNHIMRDRFLYPYQRVI
jgi:hypothetical protein